MGRVVVPLLVPVVLLVGAACAGDPDPPDLATASTAPPSGEPTVSTGPAPTVTTVAPDPPDEEAAIIAAVLGYWDAVIASGESGSPFPIRGFAVGEALETSTKRTNDLAMLGHAVRPPENSRRSHMPVVVGILGDTATVRDCSTDDTVVYDRFSGQALNDLVQTNLWETTLLRVNGRWMVERNVLQRQWDGVSACEG